MRVYEAVDLAAQVDKMRAEIRKSGSCLVGCEELALLCRDVSPHDRDVGIKQIADWEGWLFEMLPDDTARFFLLRRR